MEDTQVKGMPTVENSAVESLRVLGTGFNAHSQISSANTEDVRSFKPIPEAHGLLYAGWSTTVFTGSSGVWTQGHQRFVAPSNDVTKTFRSSFGDHDQMLGCLSTGGALALVNNGVLSVATKDSSPLVGLATIAGNGRVAVTFKQAPNGRLCHVAEFDGQDRFLRWFQDPSGGENYPSKHHMLPGRPKQLVATATSFLLLMEGGEVYSWGDPRHSNLGRRIVGDDIPPAESPGAVEALGGLKIQRIDAGAWLSAALSVDGAVYLWGGADPGAEHTIECLRGRDTADVAMVEISRPGLSDPVDFVDVAVGDGHAAVVSEGGRLFVIGSNENGQLGLSETETFHSEWREVPDVRNTRRVVCGPKSTFALTARDSTGSHFSS